MKLLFKQLTAAMLANKLHLFLIFLLFFITPFMYYFVHFSIDANLLLYSGSGNTEYLTALASNTKLSFFIFLAFLSLTAFVLSLFYTRFFMKSAESLGCLKSLGYKDSMLCGSYILFSLCLSFLGTLAALPAGYAASSLLNLASEASYQLTTLQKGLSLTSFAVGLIAPAAVALSVTLLIYYQTIGKKEAALLLFGNGRRPVSASLLTFSDRVSLLFPASCRLSVRLAMRSLWALFFLAASVMSFSVLFFLAYSLTLSSQKIYDSQTQGRSYLYETKFHAPIQAPEPSQTLLSYLDTPCTVMIEKTKRSLPQTLIGLGKSNALFELQTEDGTRLPLPSGKELIVSKGFAELYQIQKGDSLAVKISGDIISFTVSEIAFNGETNCLYASKDTLTALLSLPQDTCTGLFSLTNPGLSGTLITPEERLDTLARGMVSNKSSALINQLLGCLIGCILLYLSLLMHVQDSQRDMYILHLLGYEKKEIHRLLISVYRPALWLFFLLTLFPSLWMVKKILYGLSVQINDYMPFQTSISVVVFVFLLMNLLYFIVSLTFSKKKAIPIGTFSA